MTDTRQAKANRGSRIAGGILLIIVSLFFFLCEVGAFGGVGAMVKSFAIGFFGLAAFAYALIGIVAGVAITFGVPVRQRPSRALVYFGLLILGIYALQIYTSSANIIGAKYGEYLLACYRNTNTAGGMLFGIASFPLMKVTTTVGALVIACAAFFVLALFSLIPTMRRNVTYTAASKAERSPKQARVPRERTPKRAAEVKTRPQRVRRRDIIGKQREAALTDFSQSANSGERLYVVPVEGDPMPVGGGKNAVGSQGYRPLGSFNPFYPNLNGGYEDDAIAPPPTRDYSQQGLAKDILFGGEPGDDKLDRYQAVRGINASSQNITPITPFSAERRDELLRKLGIDGAQESATSQFISKHRAQRDSTEESKPQSGPFRDPIYNNSGNFFGKAIYETNEVRSAPLTDDAVNADEKPEVIKPTRKLSHEAINPTALRAQEAVEQSKVNVGMLGAVNRANSESEEKAVAPKPQMDEAEAYEKSEKDVAKEPVEDAAQTEQKADLTHRPTNSVSTEHKETAEGSESGGRENANELKIPRAFAGTFVQASRPEPVKRAEPPKAPVYEQQAFNFDMPKAKYKDEAPTVGGDAPGEPAPIRREVTAGNMSRSAIQATTDIAHQSGRDIEQNEIASRIENIKKSVKETPRIDRENAMNAEKIKAAKERGLGSSSERTVQFSIEQEIERAQAIEKPRKPYIAPPVSLLDPPPPPVDQGVDYEDIKQKIVGKLAEYNIKSEVVDVCVGPAFTRYDLKVEMPRGKNVSYITTLDKDISMKLQTTSYVRILAPVPGKDAVGIEVPNKKVGMVTLGELINSPEFNKSHGCDTFAIGKDIEGNVILGNVDKLPHIVIAGTTGAGKSCCINAMIVSLLYKATPDELRFVFIDPKRVELSVYKGIPHMLMDEVIYDSNKAIRALTWLNDEVYRRMDYLSAAGFKNINENNEYCKKSGMKLMPRIVVIVDEFADLMSTGKKLVEAKINGIARLARAAGIYLVIATQRPSVDVISGTIKNNLPSRIAFKVADQASSKTILDAGGAEKLLGRGDMLYLQNGAAGITRIQGAYVSNEETVRIVNYIKENNECYYESNIKDAINAEDEAEKAKESSGGSNKDGEGNYISKDLLDVLQLAIDLREKNKSISTSAIQSMLQMGYPKASRMFAMLDKYGFLETDPRDPKKHYVNISREDLEKLISENSQSKDD